MENKIFDIVTDLLREDITKTEAIDKLLVLYGVVGRSEQFSFTDMRDAFDYASVSSQRRDGMTFKEWMSKR